MVTWRQDELLIALFFVALAIIISVNQIIKHMTNFTEPKLQLYIVRIILLVPIYAITSYLSLILPKSAMLFDTLRDCYEAYVLYIFLQLMISYLGGEQVLINHMQMKRRLRHPWPFDQYFRPLSLNRQFFRKIKQGTLQFVFIKPIASIISLILEGEGIYHQYSFTLKSGYFYITIINNVSVSISLYSLALFYLATQQRLQGFKAFGKFLTIKSIVFFSYWQSVIIAGLKLFGVFGKSDSAKAQQMTLFLQDFIICIEIFFAAISYLYVFSYEDFEDFNQKRKPILTNISEVFNIGDLIYDTKETFLEDKFKDTPLQELSGKQVVDDLYEDDLYEDDEEDNFLVKKSQYPISPSSSKEMYK